MIVHLATSFQLRMIEPVEWYWKIAMDGEEVRMWNVIAGRW